MIHLVGDLVLDLVQPHAPPLGGMGIQLDEDLEIVDEMTVASGISPANASKDPIHSRHLHEAALDLHPHGHRVLQAHVGIHGDGELESALLESGHVLPPHQGEEDQASHG